MCVSLSAQRKQSIMHKWFDCIVEWMQEFNKYFQYESQKEKKKKERNHTREK